MLFCLHSFGSIFLKLYFLGNISIINHAISIVFEKLTRAWFFFQIALETINHTITYTNHTDSLAPAPKTAAILNYGACDALVKSHTCDTEKKNKPKKGCPFYYSCGQRPGTSNKILSFSLNRIVVFLPLLSICNARYARRDSI